MDAKDLAENRVRARALPVLGNGRIPAEHIRRVEDDDSGFRDVIRLFLRTWPFIKPYILGRWWHSRDGVTDDLAEPRQGDGYRVDHGPILTIALAGLGPLFGYVPASFDWPWVLIYVPVIILCASVTLFATMQGKLRGWALAVAVVSGILLNLIANYMIEGSESSIYAGLVSVAAVAAWAIEYRVNDGRIEFRVRTRMHLLFVYVLVFFERMIDLTIGLVVADVLYQSILQGQPLAPGLSSIFGLTALSSDVTALLNGEQRLSLIWVYVGVFLGLYIVQKLFQVTREYYGIWTLQMVNQDLRVALVARWHQLSLRYHSGHRTGDSVFRIYQDSAMITAVVGQLFAIAVALVGYYVSVIFVSLLSPVIGLAGALFPLPAIAVARWAMPRMRTRALVYRERTSAITSTIQEAFTSMRLIKAFNAGGRAQERMETDSQTAFNAGFQVRVIIALATITMFTVGSAFVIVGEASMAWWANQALETFSVDLIALVGLSFVVWNLASYSWARDQYRAATAQTRSVLNQWMMAQDMAMGLARVFDILDIEPDVQDRRDARPLARFQDEIRFADVRFAYEADRPILAGIDFAAAPGTVTAIVGPTGSGKSTVMSLLLRLFDPDAGTITIDGVDIRDLTLDSLRENVAIALQENVLFAMSVADNIRYVAPDASDADVAEAVRIAAMDDYVDSLPQGMDTVLSDRGGKLSTGQRQRLSIARAMVRNTPILILDEPTAALDAATEHRVMENLEAWVRDSADRGVRRTIFLITHRISTIRRADNILYIDEGQVVESGSHEALMQLDGGRYRAFVDAESQLSSGMKPGEENA